MRDLDKIKTRRHIDVDRQKISIIFATGIVIGMTIFTVGLYIGLRKPGRAEAATVDPLEALIDSGSAEKEAPAEPEVVPSDSSALKYHELLGAATEDPATPPLVPAEDEDVDAPMPVSPEDSPIPMPEDDGAGVKGSFHVPSVPSDTAFEEPARIDLPKPGSKGVYTVHVNSFSEKAAAAGYVKQLRKAGYKAFLVEAESASRGILYRVRIGPFFSHKEAKKFSKAFEDEEGVPTYVVQRILEK